MVSFRNLLVIFKRELFAYFNSAIAYIYITAFILSTNAIFMPQFFVLSRAEMRLFFDILPIVLCIFIPAVTMRLWAEDKKTNTWELLLTFPMRTQELVLGKFLAGFVFYSAALLATLPIPVMIIVLGNPDLGAIAGGYIGAFLLGGFFLAIGIFISGLCKDQISAFILGMFVCLVFYVVGLSSITVFLDGWIHGGGSFLGNIFGFNRYYTGFIKGVIDFRGFLYFFSGIGIFLILNNFYIDARLRLHFRALFSLSVILCFMIMALFNWIFHDLSIGRFDLTAAKNYTLSQTTKDILKNLEEGIIVNYYVSPQTKMPTAFKTLEQLVTDKFAEFKEVSKGKFKYKVFYTDTADNPKEDIKRRRKEDLKMSGIRPFQVKSIEEDEIEVKMLYSSIKINYIDKLAEIIHQIHPGNIEELEYLLMSKICKLIRNKPAPKIEIVAPGDKEYKLLYPFLTSEGYSVEVISAIEYNSSFDDVDALIVIQPLQLNDAQILKISNFLVKGGSLFLAGNHYEFDYNDSAAGIVVIPKRLDPGINSLIERWGVTISEDIFMDLSNKAVNLRREELNSHLMDLSVKIPINAEVGTGGMNKDISITSALSSLMYFGGSALKLNEQKISGLGLERQVLLESSPDSWELSFSAGDILIPEKIVIPSPTDRSARPLAVLLKGKFPLEEKAEDKVIDQNRGQLVVAGCSTLFEDRFFRNNQSHRAFFLNIVDALSLGEDLIKIRSKIPVPRVIKRVSRIDKIIWRFLAAFLVPIIICFWGVIYLILRQRLKNRKS